MRETTFPDAASWVDAVFRQTFLRLGDDSMSRWCPQWQDHPEAVLRLTVLWQSWEELWPGGGLDRSSWLRDHLDPHLAVLSAPQGPFARCAKGHESGSPLRAARRPKTMVELGNVETFGRMLLDGVTIEAMAHRAHLSDRTVHRRLLDLYGVLQVSNRGEALAVLRRLDEASDG